MANRTEPTTTHPASTDGLLLAQAQQTLEALQYLEQAALYHAASSSLQKAITRAQSGDTKELSDWFEQNESIRFSGIHSAATISGPAFLSRKSIQHASVSAGHSTGSESESSTQQETPQSPVGPTADLPSEEAKTTLALKNASDPLTPWAEMVSGARLRAEKQLTARPCLSEAQGGPDQATLKNDGEDLSESSEWSENPEFPKCDGRLEEGETVTLPDAPILEEHSSSCTPSFSLKSQTDPAGGPFLGRRLFSPPFWISTAIHGVLLFILSAVLIVQAQKPERLAIVSATVEAENVLLETPTETVESMEKVEESTSMSLPSLPDVNVPTPSFTPEPMIGSNTSAATQTGTASMLGGLSGPMDGLQTNKNLVAGAEFFGVKATGNTFIYVVDCSPSMARDGAFDAARQEMIRSLMSMKPKQRFSIYFFGKEIEAFSLKEGESEEYPVNASPENVQKAVSWLHRVSIQKDGRPPNEALSKAIAMQPDGIFLLFDGDTRADVAKHLRQANRSEDILSEGAPKAPIHVVHFFQEDYAPQMKKVAIENAGTYRFVPRPDRSKRSIR